MDEVAMLHGAEPGQILQTAIDRKVPSIMTYLSRGKWHVAKVLLTEITADRLCVEGIHSEEKPHPINIRAQQPLGISFKYGHGKFVFDTTVVALEPSQDPASGGRIALALPDTIEVIQRRSYFRVQVPESLKVNVLLWHRGRSEDEDDPYRRQAQQAQKRETKYESQNYCQGRLIDISAGGAQVVIQNQSDAKPDVSRDSGKDQRQDFKKGQFIGVRLTPMPYETPLVFNAQIRNVLPDADSRSAYLGLQIVGLEASPEGRRILSRLVGVVERYFKVNQAGVRPQDMRLGQSAQLTSKSPA